MEAKVISINNSFDEEFNDDVAHLVGKTGNIVKTVGEYYIIQFEGEENAYYWDFKDVQILEN